MLPFREEDMAGELYVLSLVITERQAVAPVVARIGIPSTVAAGSPAPTVTSRRR